MNKNLIAAIAALTTTASIASVSITGDYEGIAQDGNPGAASYTQDLDLKMVGSNGDTSVTILMENLTGGSTVTANQVFIESGLESLSFKGGKYKNQNGSGLMQKGGDVTNQFEVSTSVAGAALTVGQASGDGNATVDAGLEIAGLDVNVQNVSNTDRFITIVADFFGFRTTTEYQKTSIGTNVAISADASVSITEGTSVAVTGVYMDIEDTAGVTQDDGILDDVSDATTDSTIKGAVASLNTTLGTVTGKAFDKNDKMTYVGELSRGIWTFGHSKTENVDGITTAEINVSF